MFQEKIANRQLFNILFIMRTTTAISVLPVLTAAGARQDAWLAALLTFFPSAIIVYLIGRLALIFPQESMVQYSQRLTGKWLGKLLSFFYLGLFLFMGATDLHIYGEVLSSIFLPETPPIVIMGSMVILAIIVVRAGLEPLGRMADLISPLFALAIIITLFLPILEVDFGNLRPFLYYGWRPVLFATLTPIAITAQYANLAMLAPSVIEPRQTLRSALASLLWTFLILMLAAISVVGVLGADEGAHAIFPVFKMIRAVRISEFLERFEFFPTFSWGLGLFIALAVNLYSSSKGLSQLCGLKDHRPLILPLAVIIGTLALQGYSDSLETRTFFQPQIIAPFLFFVLLFPILVLWAAYLLKKGKDSSVFPEKRR